LTKDDLCELVETVAVRVARWLRKHGFAWHDQDSDSIETCEFTFDEMLAQLAAGRGTLEKVENRYDDTQATSSETNPRPPPCDGAATFCGFNLHASARVAATDDRGRERRCREGYASTVLA